MKALNQLTKRFLSILLLALPVLATAQVVEDIAASQVSAWAASGETVTVPEGSVYQLALPGGESIVINEKSQFKVIEEDGEIARIILLGGELVVDRLGNDGATVEIEVDGDVITSDGADLVVVKDASGTSISHHTNKGSPEGDGTVLVNGTPIPAGTGGILSGGSFTQDQPTEARLDILSDQLLRSITPGPRPPYERMKDLPESIVRENLNDLSPS
ncbi:MAG: FecR domain-containing protein [Puniceicoccaceae bacterium]